MLIRGLRGTRASDHLGMLRGLMAVSVLVYHVRYRFFLDYADLPESTVLAKGWYAVSAYGHDAVMVFFVISGFLVGTAVVRDCSDGTWSWWGYARARGIRLYVVLVPGLLLTAAWDALGLRMFGTHPVYTGAAASYAHDYFDVGARLSWPIFLGNATFLQSIYTPTYGSNEALWSLAYEFWYYVAFPFFAVALLGRGSRAIRLGALAAGVLALALTDQSVVLRFPVWLLGVAIGMLRPNPVIARRPREWAVAATVAGALFVTAAHSGMFRRAAGSLLMFDYTIGLAAAAVLYVLVNDRRTSTKDMYARTSALLADSSYTLYLVHLPLLVFLRASLTGNAWSAGWITVTTAAVLAAVTFGYALVVANLFEARTNDIRRQLDAWLSRGVQLDRQSA